MKEISQQFVEEVLQEFLEETLKKFLNTFVGKQFERVHEQKIPVRFPEGIFVRISEETSEGSK